MDDQRSGDRAPAEIRVEYRTVGSFLSDYALNLSRGGMFVHTENPLPVGSTVRLVFHLPGMPFMFDLTGLVRWVQTDGAGKPEGGPGMGLEFQQVDERVQRRLEAYVQKLQAEARADPDEPAAPPRVEVQRPGGDAGTQSAATLVGGVPRRGRRP